MDFKEFIVKKTRAAITWSIVFIIGTALLMAAFKEQWDSVVNLATILAGIGGTYQLSQAYTKGEFIKKVGQVDSNTLDKTIEP